MAQEVRCVHGLLRMQCATCKGAKARKVAVKKATSKTKRPAEKQKSAGAKGGSPTASLKPLRDRMRGLGREMERLGRERNAAKRAGDLAKAAELAPQVKRAKERFRAAQKEHQQAASSRSAGQNAERSAVKSTRSKRGGSDATLGLPDWNVGIHLVPDADAATHEVWITKSGKSFHNRDCQIIAANDNAMKVKVSVARGRGLERCMHCAPTVR